MQDELISREAVLDGLKGCICDEWVKTLFATMVKLLPSVTPTQKNTLENTLENTLDDAINRRASIDALKKHFSDDDIMIDTECGAYWHHGHVIEVLQGMPPVTQKPGKWIIDRSVLPYTYTCNICDRNVFDDYDYCPFCGCAMKQERSEE